MDTAHQTIVDKETELADARHTIVHKDEALKQATQAIADKDAEISEQGAKLRIQADTFSLILARIITAAIFGLPYIALCVIIATIQNDCLNWTIRGISIGAVTVIGGILLGFLYKKIETAIQKKILTKLG